MPHLALAAVVLACSAAPPVDVHVVDDDGGPGVDSTSLADAIAAAEPGDVLLVAPGSYAPFVLDKALSLIGGPQCGVSGTIRVEGIPAATATALVGIFAPSVEVRDCDGSVLVQDVQSGTGVPFGRWIDVEGARDVRLWRARFAASTTSGIGRPGLRAAGGFVEAVESTLHGSPAVVLDAINDGVRLEPGTSAVLTAVSAWGGGGLVWLGPGGTGGSGLFVAPTASAVLTSSQLFGGWAGYHSHYASLKDCSYDGLPSSAAHNLGQLVVRDGTGTAGSSFFGHHCVFYVGAVWAGVPPLRAPQPTPRLAIEHAPRAGSPMRVDVWGEPGAGVALALSNELVVEPVPGASIPVLVGPSPLVLLGTLSPQGRLTIDVPLPAGWTVGQIGAMQVQVAGTGPAQLSNSIPLVVRP